MNSFKVNKAIRASDVTYRTVDEVTERIFPLDILDIIVGYDRYDKTHFHPQLLEQVEKNVQNPEKISPIFADRVKYLLAKISQVDGRLNKVYVSFMLFDYICDFRFLYRDSSLSFINVVKNKLNFFYFTEKIVNAGIYYSIIIGDDIEPGNSIRHTGTRRKLCSLCKLPGHNKRKCEKLDLFTAYKGRYFSDGFNWYGYNVDGRDRDGYNREGFHFSGYNREGYNREGRTWDGYDRDGYDREGYDRDFVHREGYDVNGYDMYGYDIEGYDIEGYDRSGYNREGYDRNGYDSEDREW